MQVQTMLASMTCVGLHHQRW